MPHSAKRMAGRFRSVMEIRVNYKGDAYRLMYTHEFTDAIYVLHVFKQKSKTGSATPLAELDRITGRLKQARQISQVRT
jgi:phage-related protein